MKLFRIAICVLSLWLCASTVKAQFVISGTVTVTNVAGTTNGQTITVNGALRYFTNNVTQTTFQIATNSSIGGSASNIWIFYSIAPDAGGIKVSQSGTNAVIFRALPGAANVISLSANWGTVVMSTQNISDAVAVRVPKTVEGAIQTTNISSGLVSWISDP